MKLTLLAFVFLFSQLSSAATQIKIAALIPEGTSWGNSVKKFAQEVATATKGEVNVKIYYGGVAGDEPDVLRKIRIGQLQGGIFTGKTLAEIYPDVRVMEIPFTFYNDQKKAARVMADLTPKFNAGFKQKGFVNLGFYELGLVYLVSTKKVTSLNELKGIKIWSWEGDELSRAMIESMELVSTPLALPDVLSSLSTGIINAAYAPPLGILALQWQTKIKYLVDFPTTFSIGALLLSDKVWTKISPDNQKKIQEISAKYVKEANDKSLVENEAARTQMKKSGIEFVSFPQEDYKKAADLRATVIQKLIKGNVISAEMIKEFDKEVKK
jgi:TRAP-type C4-dicarboxylate transport system substrate-binding protein